MPQVNQSLASRIGFVLTRMVVPLWVVMGATFKLVERTPANLPSQILEHARGLGITGVDMFTLLGVLIFIEFAAVIVMLFSARWARPMAIFILSVFCLVLINEMVIAKNFTSCGCLGKVPIKPWQMLAIDAALLAGVIFLRPRYSPDRAASRWTPIAAGVAIVAAFAATANMVIQERRPVHEQPAERITDASPDDPTVNPSPAPLPSLFTTDGIDSWIGKPWREVPIFQVMRRWPSNMDEGRRYVVFYSRTCDHCEQMFEWDLVGLIETMTTAVEIPASRTELRGSGAWAMPETQMELLQLPLGPMWLMAPPVAVAVENGIVICAQEGDHKRCFDLE